MKCKWEQEGSPTSSFIGMEGVLLAVSPTGGFFSCTGGFREVSQDGEASLGAAVVTGVVVSIRVFVGEKTKRTALIRRPKRRVLLFPKDAATGYSHFRGRLRACLHRFSSFSPQIRVNLHSSRDCSLVRHPRHRASPGCGRETQATAQPRAEVGQGKEPAPLRVARVALALPWHLSSPGR